MKRRILLSAACLLGAMSANAQDTGEVITLLPNGITANISSERKMGKQKNLIVAGSPEKGYKAFFSAIDEAHGEELWVTDGTPEGTHIVKDIIPGAGSSGPSYLARLNDKVLFSADDGENGREFWVSDGTEEGTFMLADTYIMGDGNPKGVMQINETQAVFSAISDESAEYDPDQGAMQWLWITDGTVNGTHLLCDQCNVQNPGQDNTNLHTPYVRVGRRGYFKAKDLENRYGEELWVTDGTPEGTYMVMDINLEANPDVPGFTRNCGLDNLENYQNERVFFQAWTETYGSEPWTSDGTPEGTYMIKDTNPSVNPDNGIGHGAGTFGPSWEVYKGRMWYRGYSPTGGFEFAGTNMQKDDYVYFDIFTTAPSVDHCSYADPGCVFQDVFLFCASTGFDAADPTCHGGELWCCDGEKVWEQMDFVPGTGCDWVKEQTVCGGSLYWYNEANDVAAGYGSGLYRLDDVYGTPVVCNTITATGDFVHSLRNLAGTCIYASTATGGLYAYNYTKPGWDGKSDMGYLEPEYRTPSEIAAGQENAISSVSGEEPGAAEVYSVDGKHLRTVNKSNKATEGLTKGVYVVGGKKISIK